MKRRAHEVYGLQGSFVKHYTLLMPDASSEPSVLPPEAPWVKRKAELAETDEAPGDVAIVIDHYARELQNCGLPPLVPRSFIDGTLEDHTAVQHELEELVPVRLRSFRIQDEVMYAWTKDYEEAIRSQMEQQCKSNDVVLLGMCFEEYHWLQLLLLGLINSMLERFIERIVRKHADMLISFNQLAYMVVCDLPEVPDSLERARRLGAGDVARTEQLITLLFKYSLMVRHASSTTSYWLHYPNAGLLCRQLKAHRAESIARLERTRWKEMLESDLIGRHACSLSPLYPFLF